jgi:hypothetical protein
MEKHKRLIRVYCAGSYSANNVLDVLRNIGRGEKVCADLFCMGYAPFCPWHDKSYVIDRPDHNYTVQDFYDYSIAWLAVSDCMYVLPGSENSKGTQAEILFAKENGIPIYFDINKIPRP